jgi:hypothetical protein
MVMTTSQSAAANSNREIAERATHVHQGRNVAGRDFTKVIPANAKRIAPVSRGTASKIDSGGAALFLVGPGRELADCRALEHAQTKHGAFHARWTDADPNVF